MYVNAPSTIDPRSARVLGRRNVSALEIRRGLGCAGCGGQCQSGLGNLATDILGGFSLQTVWIMAGVGYVLYRAFFSDNAGARRRALRQVDAEYRKKRRQVRKEYGYA